MGFADHRYMKQKLSHFGLIAFVAAAYFALSDLSSATLINITINPATGLPSNDINSGLMGNNSLMANFNFLSSDVDLYNSYAGTNLTAPISSEFANYNNLNGSNQVSLTGFDYAVIHWMKGTGGTQDGDRVLFPQRNNGRLQLCEHGLWTESLRRHFVHPPFWGWNTVRP